MKQLNLKQWLIENDAEHSVALRTSGFWGRQAAGAIFLSQDTKKLGIAHRSMAVQEGGHWGSVGGAIDSDEDPSNAVQREIQEEIGYHGTINLIPLYIFEHPSGFKYHNFLAVVPKEFSIEPNWETDGFKWCDLNNLPKPLHFGLTSLFNDAKSMNIIKSYLNN